MNQAALPFAAPLDLVPQPRARRSDPATSHEAAREMRGGKADDHRRAILKALREGSMPMDAHQISKATGYTAWSAIERGADGMPCRLHLGGSRAGLTPIQVSRRMHELEAAALVRVVGRNGRFQTYALVEENTFTEGSAEQKP